MITKFERIERMSKEDIMFIEYANTPQNTWYSTTTFQNQEEDYDGFEDDCDD